MDNKKQYFVQDAHSVLQGNNTKFDGYKGSSDENPGDPDYTSSNKDMKK